MATYPFLKVVSESIGRLLKLQETTTTSQIQRRIREKYGERETVSKSVQRIIASLVDWGVLERRDRGIYGSKGVMQIENKELIVWIVEAMLHTIPSGRSSLQEILHSPSLFAFSFDWIPVDVLTGSNQLEVVRHGLDRELLILKEQ